VFNVVLLVFHILGLAADIWNSINYIQGTYYTTTRLHILDKGRYAVSDSGTDMIV
jgi:hypothetical protein